LAPASFITGTLIVLLNSSPEHARGTLLGLHGAVSSLSFATGPAFALWLMGPGRGAPWLFLASGGAGLAAACLIAAAGLATSPSRLAPGTARNGPPLTDHPSAPSQGDVDFGLLARAGVRRACGLIGLAGMGSGGTLSFAAVHALRVGLGSASGLFIALAFRGAAARSLAGRLADPLGSRTLLPPAPAVLAGGPR